MSRSRAAGALATHHATITISSKDPMLAKRIEKSALARSKRLKQDGRQTKVIVKREAHQFLFKLPPTSALLPCASVEVVKPPDLTNHDSSEQAQEKGDKKSHVQRRGGARVKSSNARTALKVAAKKAGKKRKEVEDE